MFRQTREQKQSYVNGLGLFFGALLGANMGVLTDLAPSEYLKVILLLAGVVLWIQMLSASRSRLHALRMLAALVLPAVILIAFPQSRPQGLTDRQAYNMAATLAVWLVCVALIEVTPLVPEPAAGAGTAAPVSPPAASRSGASKA
ncbi:hypothetical protein FGE12_02895 [Aggregicoccus sp. 17bor-14]|uniref:hypothetical protein n=1 Tax=Myxococcaceae TaxID=31 RepID=UPI00129C16E0|nr:MULTISPECIES: hypothetical protein [Myxococcaceae]MBF5041318.1 hypothetical protein [Simulacricoccus sp. 17bor-14]MRI87104.1 hypothetical protein [Aggregicoccus sp. 17bor-14]